MDAISMIHICRLLLYSMDSLLSSMFSSFGIRIADGDTWIESGQCLSPSTFQMVMVPLSRKISWREWNNNVQMSCLKLLIIVQFWIQIENPEWRGPWSLRMLWWWCFRRALLFLRFRGWWDKNLRSIVWGNILVVLIKSKMNTVGMTSDASHSN